MDASVRGKAAAALLAVVAVCGAPDAHAATADNFTVRNAGDLVALCETPTSEANYVAAVHFCHGFASGAFQYYQAVAQADPAQRFVCPPNPPPTRNQAIAGFVAWAKGKTNVMSGPAADALFRYLGETYPCRTAPAGAPR